MAATDAPATTFTYDEVLAALNAAADDIATAAELPDTGTIDALNLLVNAVPTYLTGPASLNDVADTCYGEADLDEIISWIHGS